MSELVANCPRCKAQEMTFDLVANIQTRVEYDWQRWHEAFCVCRKCFKPTIFVLAQKEYKDNDLVRKYTLEKMPFAVNQVMAVKGYISLKDEISDNPPEYLPKNIDAIFREGATCMAVGCYNASATMFRLCIDLATKSMLPQDDNNGLNNKIRKNLGLRLPWLFANGILPNGLEELSSCIKDDGNDGAHEGTLGEEDAENILDFAYVLLERLYTEPKRVQLAKERRQARIKPNE